MTQPLENVLALAFANVRLGLKLAETWRESGQNLMELATRGAAEISEETGVALVASMSADKGATVNSVNGHWQDLLAEVEAVRDATAREIETAFEDWRNSWSEAVRIDASVSAETFLKPWLAMARPATASKA